MLPDWYLDYKKKVELFLAEWFDANYLKEGVSQGVLKRFLKATRYGFEGGKRFRGVLAMV